MAEAPDGKTRQHPRYEVDVLVDFTGTEVLLCHRVVNLSLGGLCLQSPEVEEVGALVDLVLNFPDLGETSFSVQGEVVWANREPPMDMGIRYLDLDDRKRDILRRYLAEARSGRR